MIRDQQVFESIAYLDSDCRTGQLVADERMSSLPVFLIGYVAGIGAGFFWRFIWSLFR